MNLLNIKISIFILFFVCILTIVISNYLCEYEAFFTRRVKYIVLANDLNSYFTLPHQGALRILSFLVFCLSIIGISVEMGFKYLTYFFIFLILNFLSIKDFNLKNYLVLPSIAILIYSNHSVIYTVFNYYQLIDLFTHIYIVFHSIT